jgi:hypothetical protein
LAVGSLIPGAGDIHIFDLMNHVNLDVTTNDRVSSGSLQSASFYCLLGPRFGTIWIPDEPFPMTATFLPSKL